MVKDEFLKKLYHLRYKYGNAEADYFAGHPVCEVCSEPRLACLAIHHREGHGVKSFQTLCFNCHMAHHHPRAAAYTYKNYLQFLQAKKAKREAFIARDHGMVNIWRKTRNLRKAGRELGVSHNTVRNALRRTGVEQ